MVARQQGLGFADGGADRNRWRRLLRLSLRILANSLQFELGDWGGSNHFGLRFGMFATIRMHAAGVNVFAFKLSSIARSATLVPARHSEPSAMPNTQQRESFREMSFADLRLQQCRRVCHVPKAARPQKSIATCDSVSSLNPAARIASDPATLSSLRSSGKF